jgi:hypothetical protein
MEEEAVRWSIKVSTLRTFLGAHGMKGRAERRADGR